MEEGEFRDRILQGNALPVLRTLPDNSFDGCITSPPYWALRDYKTEPQIWGGSPTCDHVWAEGGGGLAHDNRNNLLGSQEDCQGASGTAHIRKYDCTGSKFCKKCGAWKGQLGLEPHFDLFVEHLIMIFDEVKRVLKPTGTCWVVIGDTYMGGNVGVGTPDWWESISMENVEKYHSEEFDAAIVDRNKIDYPDKSLTLVPFRFASAMADRGWVVRNVVVWKKPIPMPFSGKDRFTVSFEYIFFFTKQQNYYFEQQLIPCVNTSELKNERAIWEIANPGTNDKHFASYPEELARKCLVAGVPEAVCAKCGKPRMKQFKQEFRGETEKSGKRVLTNGRVDGGLEWDRQSKRVFVGLSDCGCGAGWKRGIVLDPFMGRGTTAYAAKRNARDFTGIELNPDYIRMAEANVKEMMTFKRHIEDYLGDTQ